MLVAAQPRKTVRSKMYGEVGNITKPGAPKPTVGANWKKRNCGPNHVAIGIGSAFDYGIAIGISIGIALEAFTLGLWIALCIFVFSFLALALAFLSFETFG